MKVKTKTKEKEGVVLQTAPTSYNYPILKESVPTTKDTITYEVIEWEDDLEEEIIEADYVEVKENKYSETALYLVEELAKALFKLTVIVVKLSVKLLIFIIIYLSKFLLFIYDEIADIKNCEWGMFPTKSNWSKPPKKEYIEEKIERKIYREW